MGKSRATLQTSPLCSMTSSYRLLSPQRLSKHPACLALATQGKVNWNVGQVGENILAHWGLPLLLKCHVIL